VVSGLGLRTGAPVAAPAVIRAPFAKAPVPDPIQRAFSPISAGRSEALFEEEDSSRAFNPRSTSFSRQPLPVASPSHTGSKLTGGVATAMANVRGDHGARASAAPSPALATPSTSSRAQRPECCKRSSRWHHNELYRNIPIIWVDFRCDVCHLAVMALDVDSIKALTDAGHNIPPNGRVVHENHPSGSFVCRIG
jgi:hypothetical protein